MKFAFLTATDRACSGMNTNLFIPEHGQHSKDAKAVCRTCPHITACLAYARETGDDHAILGGTTAAERRKTRERQKTPLQQVIAARRAAVASMSDSGLTPTEISGVLRLPLATVTADKIHSGKRAGAQADPNLNARIDELDQRGVSPTAIAQMLHIGRRTVYNRRAQRAAEREQVAA
jgi:hypothetical protein